MNTRDSTDIRERRRFPRLTGNFSLKYKTINENTSIQAYRMGTTCDLARGGLRFLTTEELKIGDTLAIQLTIPAGNRVIAALTEVLRVTPIETDTAEEASGQFEVGVCFLWSGWHDGEMQREISDFIQEELGD